MKPAWHYHVLLDDRIEVTEEGSGRVFVPELVGVARGEFRVHIFERWYARMVVYARAIGLPPANLAGIVRAENEEGDPRKGERGGGAGVGLGQLTSKDAKGPYTDVQLRDPDLNLRQTCAHIARGMKWLKDHGWPVDLPHIVATYNAGSPQKKHKDGSPVDSVWGLYTHNCDALPPEREHISRAVLASNTAISFLLGPPDPSVPRVLADDEITPVTIDTHGVEAATDRDLRTLTAEQIREGFFGPRKDDDQGGGGDAA